METTCLLGLILSLLGSQQGVPAGWGIRVSSSFLSLGHAQIFTLRYRSLSNGRHAAGLSGP